MSHLCDDGRVVTVVPPGELTDDIVTTILRALEGVLTAIFWIEAPPVAHRVFSNASEAMAWARLPFDSEAGA